MEIEEKEVSLKNLFSPFTNKKAIIFLILIGSLVYFNSFFNGFVLDDVSQIVNNTRVHSIHNIGTFFQGGTFNPTNARDNLTGVYYKPLMTTYFSLIYSVFGQNPFFFHLLQVCLHIANSLLVYFFLLRFFKRNLSFLISLIFLVHPINVESIAYISASQETLFLFFGMLAMTTLSYSEKIKKIPNGLKYFSVFMLTLLSLLSKETGFLFIIILPVFGYLFRKSKAYFLVAPMSLGTYLFLRLFIGQIALHANNISPISLLPLIERFVNIPKIIFYFLLTFIAPINLYSSQTWTIKTIGFQNFYLPLFFVIAFFLALFYLGYYIFLKKKSLWKLYIFFMLWFLVGIGFHIQIIPLDSTVAERWFYFPIIGLMGLFGILAISIKDKWENKKMLTMVCLVCLACMYGIRVFYRNANWQSTLSIVSHDIEFQKDNSYLQNTLALELSKKGNLNDAAKHFQLAYSLDPQSAILSNLAITYAKMGDIPKAEQAYKKLLSVDEKYYNAYVNLVYIFVKTNDLQKASETARKGLKIFPNDERLLILSSFAEYKAGRYKEAVELISRAYKYTSNESTKVIYEKIQRHESIDEYL